MQVNPLAIVVLLCGAMSAAIAVYAWHHRATRGSLMFSYFMTAMALYVLGYSMELASLELPTMLFWSKIGYLGIFAFPTLFLLFVLEYTCQDQWITRRNILFLFLIPLFLLTLKFSDDYFHLVYSSTWVDFNGLIPLLGFTRGPLYPLAFYSAVPICLAIGILWKKRNHTPMLYRGQASLMVISTVGPLFIFIVYMSGYQPFPGLKYLDWNAFMYLLWGVGAGWAAFRYRLFELAPIAREALIEHLTDGVFVLDEQSRLVDANPVALRILGITQPPLGDHAQKVFSSWKELWAVCQDNQAGISSYKEIQYLVNDDISFFDLNITVLRNKSGRNIGRLLLIHDITERKRLEKQLLDLSLVDELTGLNNRRGFYLLATQFMNMANRMNLSARVIFADVDEMKSINDTFGHAEGDRALVDAANIMRQTSRSSDILARLGGDEFVSLAIEMNDYSAEAMLDRINSQIDEFNVIECRKYPLSISFGAAYSDPELPCDLDELLDEADQAMYEQKQAKKKCLPVR